MRVGSSNTSKPPTTISLNRASSMCVLVCLAPERRSGSSTLAADCRSFGTPMRREVATFNASSERGLVEIEAARRRAKLLPTALCRTPMKYERPQRGNPHELTVNQHILPRRSIERFCGLDGRVHVNLLAPARELRLEPEDPLFCARRVWDQRAESGFGKGIEDRFQAVAHVLAGSPTAHVEPGMNATLTQMYLLWRHRSLLARQPPSDVAVRGVIPERELSIDSQERLEKNGVIFLRPDMKLSSRVVAGITLQRSIDRDWMSGAHSMTWGVLRSSDLEFMVPDAFIDQPVLPLTPNACLAAGMADDFDLSLVQVASLNREAIRATTRYWFARDPDRCPVLRASLF